VHAEGFDLDAGIGRQPGARQAQLADAEAHLAVEGRCALRLGQRDAAGRHVHAPHAQHLREQQPAALPHMRHGPGAHAQRRARAALGVGETIVDLEGHAHAHRRVAEGAHAADEGPAARDAGGGQHMRGAVRRAGRTLAGLREQVVEDLHESREDALRRMSADQHVEVAVAGHAQ